MCFWLLVDVNFDRAEIAVYPVQTEMSQLSCAQMPYRISSESNVGNICVHTVCVHIHVCVLAAYYTDDSVFSFVREPCEMQCM